MTFDEHDRGTPRISSDELAKLTEVTERFTRSLAEKKYVIQGVIPCQGDSAPPFYYTVGLSRTCGYELAISGLPYDVVHVVVDSAVQTAAECAIGDRVEQLLRGYPMLVREATDASHFAMHRAFLHRNPPVRQLLWPDPSGLFPGEKGCTLSVNAQHLL